MKFTIDALKLILVTHRLKKDGNFKEIDSDASSLYDDDFLFDSYIEANNWISQQGDIQIGEEVIEENRLGVGLADVYLNVRPHRTSKPKQVVFRKQDVENALRNGDDNQNNVLVVDWDGYVHLVPSPLKGEKYAVRIESFHAGNGYVGGQSGLNHLDGTYKTLLEGWLTHLETGDSAYRDYPSARSEDAIITEIREVYNKL